MKKRFFLSLIAVSLVFVSCFEDFDDNDQTASLNEINNFIYRGLNYIYLYKADTPELANNAFSTDEAKQNFLDSFDTPADLFRFLKSPQDRFSFLVTNYVSLENSLGGTTLNNGMEYGIVRFEQNPNKVFGYVRYVLPNTSASENGVVRGQIFDRVDGQELTIDNFGPLLFQETYTIGLATIQGQTTEPTGETITLTKAQYTENPVHIAKTLEIDGRKIGYLMYNAFTSFFDGDLNRAFADFKADGITELVVDLRYNGGGSVESAKDLSSMITGQFEGQLFYTEQWNADRQEANAENAFFDANISTGEAINSLNLNKAVFITTKSSASASELVINSLSPYIEVVQIGDFTTGKFQASRLVYDAPAPHFNRSDANPNHTYAMLPLIFKTANAVGNTDYVNGLAPDIELKENFTDLGILGNQNEPLLAAALQNILGRPTFSEDFQNFEEVSSSDANSPLFQLMIAE